MENVGITQLYINHASNIITIHEEAGTVNTISRARIEQQLLVELEKSTLPSLLKIAWFAAVLKGRHFNAFWVKTLDRLHLSQQQIEHYRPDKTLYDHHVPDAEPSTPATSPAAEPALPPSPTAANPTPAPRSRRNPTRRAHPAAPPAPAAQPGPAAAHPASAAARPTGILKNSAQPSRRRGPRRVEFAPRAHVRRF